MKFVSPFGHGWTTDDCLDSNSHQEALRRLDQLNQDYQQERLDHARETLFNRDVQRRELQLQDELRKLKATVVGRSTGLGF